MKNLSVFILGMMLFSFGVVSCKKDSTPIKTPEEIRQEQNDQARNLLEGKWQREDLIVDGYNGDELVDENVEDPGILSSVAEFLPRFLEITKSRFIIIDAETGDPKEQAYEVDAENGTITIIDDQGDEITEDDRTVVKYTFENNNQSLVVTLRLDEDFGEYDNLKIRLNLNKVTEFLLD